MKNFLVFRTSKTIFRSIILIESCRLRISLGIQYHTRFKLTNIFVYYHWISKQSSQGCFNFSVFATEKLYSVVLSKCSSHAISVSLRSFLFTSACVTNNGPGFWRSVASRTVYDVYPGVITPNFLCGFAKEPFAAAIRFQIKQKSFCAWANSFSD